MLVYLLKSSACLLVFSLFYKLFLEKENIHLFKRYYLLGSLAMAFYVPFITFTTYVEQPVVDLVVSNTTAQNSFEMNPREESIHWFPLILWSLYGLGILFFAIKFLWNLFKLTKKIRSNEKIKHKDYVHVLLLKHIVPHTFMKYIFLDKQAFDNYNIPQEILLHEQAHAQQKHSLDILFVELLQIILWFNPLIYIFKKDIKLNHEFLADHEVINHGYNTKNYQNILLSYSSKKTGYALESSFNYSSIKKRFTVMNTNTSKRAVWLRSLILLPMLAFLIYGFSEKKEVQIKFSAEGPIYNSIPEPNTTEENYLELEVNKGGLLFHESKQIQIEQIGHLVKMENGLQIKLIYKAYLTKEKSNVITKEIGQYLKSQKVQNFGICSSYTEMDQLPLDNTSTENYQEGASKEQLAEYNKLAKYYNNLPKDNPVVKLDDLKRLKYLYSIMTEEQKKNAEPFPNQKFPPPPPPASKDLSDKELKAQKEMESRAKSGKSYSWQYVDEEGKKITVIANHTSDSIPPPPPAPKPEKEKKSKKAPVPTKEN